MKRLWFAPILLLAAIVASGQSDRGAITGRVVDQGGGAIANAPVVLTNLATGVQTRVNTTDTGNYTFASVPAATYKVSVEWPGFKKFEQVGVTVSVAQTVRVDVSLLVGSTGESVTVTADAAQLKTDSAEQSTVLAGGKINDLPLNFANSGAIRNPLAFAQLAPGTTVGEWNDVRVNGAAAYTYHVLYDGLDATSSIHPALMDEQQPSVDAIAEFAVQSGTFAAEYGQVGGGVFNFTSKSGTNQFHGSAYEYLANEAFNAGVPFTDDGMGGHIRSRVRQHDFGGTIGGPVILPKLYNGRERTFFFFSFEKYRNVQNAFDGMGTLPTMAYRQGDFASLITGRVLNTDPLGRNIVEGLVYDPSTQRTVNGQIVRDPYPGNRIPQSQFDPVAVKIQSLLPSIDSRYQSLLVNNFERRYSNRKLQTIPSIKIDHSLNDRMKLTGSYASQNTDKDNGRDGLPDPISARRWETIRSHTIRVSHDYTISPTLLNHLSLGFVQYNDPDSTPITDYDAAAELGLKGGVEKGFPRITGLTMSLGPTNYQRYLLHKPTAAESLSWVRGNHSMKFGGTWTRDIYTNQIKNGTTGGIVFASSETTLPSVLGQSLQGGTIGYSYASFLLGRVNNASLSNTAAPQYRRSAWAGFAQDNWKVTRKLTLEFGLRYDWQSPARELHYRETAFSPTTPNPSAGGLLGATVYEGYGPGRCNCVFAQTYPYAFGPRLGFAYAVNPKTVVRGGWGITYGALTAFNWFGGTSYSLGFGWNRITWSTPSYGDAALQLRDGFQYSLSDLNAVNLSAGIRPSAGQINSPPPLIDNNGGRPPRFNNWSFGIQREITPNLAVEAAYVGNRGVWLRADALVDMNALTPERIRAAGLDINSAADRAILTSRISSAQAVARGFTVPYGGFPGTATVAQSLRPYPQFGSLTDLYAPLGNTWYDSLQVKVNKRYSHGLDLMAAYTWSKSLATATNENGATVPVNDVFNRRNQKTLSPADQPHVLTLAARYEIPAPPALTGNRVLRALARGWYASVMVRYASGLPIATPSGQNSLSSILFRSTRSNRVAGVPLYTKDINGDIDPNKDFVLNPAAWSDPAPGQWGTAAAYYSDYRDRRHPSEQVGLGKQFRLREGMSLDLRGEFFNVLNRIVLPAPTSGNALATQRVGSDGVPISGFGRIDSGSAGSSRSGQVVMRFRF